MSLEAPQQQLRSGFVALVGRPNVGKSTLLNYVLGEKVAIVSPKPQTTRTRIHGILNRPDAQLVFVDTPGLSSGKSALHKAMRRVAGEVADDAEVGLVVINIGRDESPAAMRVAKEDRELVARVRKSSGQVVVAVNKVDRVQPKQRLLPWLDLYHRELQLEDIFPISARTGDGVDTLVSHVAQRLPLGEPYFPRDLHTDQAERFICQELVREQLLFQTEQEVPHSAVVVIELFEDERDDTQQGGLCRLEGRIILERDSQKGIVVGKRGVRIKEISTRARQQMEQLLGCKVYLRLTVHVDKDWTKSPVALRKYGLDGIS